MMTETIFAQATSTAGLAGLAVIRISGPHAGAALSSLSGAPLPAPRFATRAFLRDPESGEPLDDCLVLWFPAPHSYTGEDVAELHIHGGFAVVEGVLAALGASPDFRLAQPGEFTRRAFDNAKMDLTALEGLADLIAAETAAQRHQALRQMKGDLGSLYEGWRERLLQALAHLEATLDFSDEDLPEEIDTAVRRDVAMLCSEIESHLEDGHQGERLRRGVRVAIIGPPNVGKSSLLNLLARRDVAIVSEAAGTTRDVIEVHLDLGGIPVLLADTAGLREGVGGIEEEGVRRAKARAEDADLRLVVFDLQSWPKIGAEKGASQWTGLNALVVLNKIDLGRPKTSLAINGKRPLEISVKTEEGIEVLLKALQKEVSKLCQLTAAPALTRRRHREALENCRVSLVRAAEAQGADLVAEDLRLASRALGRVTGRVEVEDVLDVIFQDFCIGK
jgi:tRNA modification GTPase